MTKKSIKSYVMYRIEKQQHCKIQKSLYSLQLFHLHVADI